MLESSLSSMDDSLTSNTITPLSSSTSPFVLISFSHSIFVKLNKKNFLILRKQVETAIKGYKLSKFINEIDSIPPKFLSSMDEASGKINKDYSD